MYVQHTRQSGIFFIDNANDMTNAKAYGQSVVATNPCGGLRLTLKLRDKAGRLRC